MKTVLLTSLDSVFDRKLAAAFARDGYQVFALGGQPIAGVVSLPTDLKQAYDALERQAGYLDLYIDLSDERCPSDNFTVRSRIDDKVMRELYDANVLRPMAMLEAFLPLLEKGEGKRLCYLTAAEASINETRAIDGFGYKMGKAALHNFLQIVKNVLKPNGYTLRAFDPMRAELAPETAAEAALNYFTRNRGVERGDPHRDDEDNLVFRDAEGRHHSW